MNLLLLREYQDSCTSGVLYIPDTGKSFFTIEQPWSSYGYGKGGTPYASCVPEGVYQLVPHHSTQPHILHTWALVNTDLHVFHTPQSIPDELVDTSNHELSTARAMRKFHARYSCLAGHVGNSVLDVLGCIVLGTSTNKSKTYVGSSRVAMEEYRRSLAAGSTEHTIEIRKSNLYGTAI